MACARAPQAPLTSAPRASLGELDAGEVNCSGAAAGAGTDDTLAASQLTKERRRTRAPAQRQARNEHERACRARRATTQELHAVDSILEAVHDAGVGSTIRVNSARWRTLSDEPTRDEAQMGVEADIAEVRNVPLEENAARIATFASGEHVGMDALKLRAVLQALGDPIVGCRQGIIADYQDVIAGCTKGNAMITSLGAGDGSKATAMYQIKYASKESVAVTDNQYGSGPRTEVSSEHAQAPPPPAQPQQ